MKKLITFFSGLVLIALMIAMLFVTSAIYDSAKKTSVDPYFFQTNLQSSMRTGAPETPAQIGETAMREMLIQKYVNEYFYAIPDIENIANRMGKSSPLARMSAPSVFNTWLDTTAEEIQNMAEKKQMRTVYIDGEIFKPSDSDFWIVPYILYTWESANDMNTAPVITHGILRMNIAYESGIREIMDNDTFDVGKYLKRGYNRFESGIEPAVIFRFRVMQLENRTND